MKVCMISYSVYEYDNRVHRYGTSLINDGHDVDVFSLGIREKGLKKYHGADVYQVQCRKMDEKGPLSYLSKMLLFFLRTSFLICKRHLCTKYDVIHFHNIPDFGIFITLIPKIFGARIILDIHDLVPEFYARKFNLQQTHIIIRTLKFIEKLSCMYADHVITVTDMWKEKLTDRSVPASKCTVILNAPLPALFDTVALKNPDHDQFTMLYHGALNEHFGVDIAVRAVAIARQRAPSILFNIYGRGREEAALRQLIDDLDLSKNVIIHTPVIRDQIPGLIAEATIGVVPKRSAEFADEALSSKLLEFAYMRKPVIVSRTTASTHYFDDTMVLFFEPENYQELAGCMITLYKKQDLRQTLSNNIDRFNQAHHWNDYFQRYITVLTGERSPV